MTAAARRGGALAYPATRRTDYAEQRHGRSVGDPYHWLEGEETGEVAAWVGAQQALTDGYFATATRQDAIRRWLEGFLDAPFVFHAIDTERRRFMLEERPGVEQPVVMVRDWRDGAETMVVGPADLAADPGGPVLAQDALFPSPCGRFLAYAVRRPGADFASLRVRDVEAGVVTAADFPLTVLPAVTWSADSGGFFYNQNQGEFLPAEQRATRPDGIWRRELGAGVESDRLVQAMTWSDAHVAIPTLSEDGAFLFVNLLRLVADVSALMAIPLAVGAPAGEPIALVSEGLAAFSYLGEGGGRYFFETNLGAPDGRVVAFDLTLPASPRMVEIVGEQDRPLARSTRSVRSERSIVIGDRLYLTGLDKTRHRVVEYDLAGRPLGELALPPASSVGANGGDRYGAVGKARGDGLIIALWSFAEPPRAFVWDPASRALTPAADRRPPRLEGVEVRQIEYRSFDGAQVPASIVALKSTPRDGSAPCLLYGYGGAGMAITPEFAFDVLGWVALGGVWVLANIRGGGEMGEAWHAPARRGAKQVTFADFQAGAEHLIAEDLARPASLGIRGVSYGGLMVGACLTQRPDLFGAVVAEVPLLDPLSIGKTYWSAQLAPEIGDPTKNAEAFAAIARYSPLQNLATGVAYPPTLVVIADADAPLLVEGGRKFVATLQSLDGEGGAGGGPHLVHFVRGAGHGGWSKSQQLDTASRELAFLAANLAGGLNRLESLR